MRRFLFKAEQNHFSEVKNTLICVFTGIPGVKIKNVLIVER